MEMSSILSAQRIEGCGFAKLSPSTRTLRYAPPYRSELPFDKLRRGLRMLETIALFTPSLYYVVLTCNALRIISGEGSGE